MLFSECHPEKGGTFGNGCVNYHQADALGRPTRVLDGPQDVTLTYDRARRLVQVRETTGAARVRDGNWTTASADYFDYMMARYYHPQLGRFLSTDPINSAKPTDPITWNKYVYGLNSPVRWVDPDGEEPLPANLQQFFGAFFSADVSLIEIHTDASANRLAARAKAAAITFGPNIYLSALTSQELGALRPCQTG